MARKFFGIEVILRINDWHADRDFYFPAVKRPRKFTREEGFMLTVLYDTRDEAQRLCDKWNKEYARNEMASRLNDPKRGGRIEGFRYYRVIEFDYFK